MGRTGTGFIRVNSPQFLGPTVIAFLNKPMSLLSLMMMVLGTTAIRKSFLELVVLMVNEHLGFESVYVELEILHYVVGF